MSLCFRFFRPIVLARPEQTGVTVLVFKTSIRSILDIKAVDETISHLPGLRRWNVDSYDIDNVLRIETTRPDPAGIIGLVKGAGFLCEELPD